MPKPPLTLQQAWRSNVPAVKRALMEGQNPGLIAAAQILVNEVKLGLRGGYTSGAFTVGLSTGAVTRSPPILGPRGMFVLVGTNLKYNLYWELGHKNIFTRRYERVRVWMPAFERKRFAMRAAFNAQLVTALEAVPKL